MISCDKNDSIPLHLITKEILKCKSSKVYFFEDGLRDYNLVFGAKNKEDTIGLELI